MSFLKITSALAAISAAILIPMSSVVANRFFSKDPFTEKELEVLNSNKDLYLSSNFSLKDGNASFIISDEDVQKNKNDKKWICIIFAITENQEKSKKVLSDSNFDGNKWTEIIKEKLKGENKKENRKGLVESCSRNRWERKGAKDGHETSVVFFDLKQKSGKWDFEEKNIESLFKGIYDSPSHVYSVES